MSSTNETPDHPDGDDPQLDDETLDAFRRLAEEYGEETEVGKIARIVLHPDSDESDDKEASAE